MNLYQDQKIYRVLKLKNHEEWLNQRQKGIGGSDAAVIAGVHPYTDARSLWLLKQGKLQPEDVSMHSAVQYGTDAEEYLRQLFALDYPDYDVQYQEHCILQHRTNAFLQYSSDGLLVQNETKAKGILEIKTASFQHISQCQHWQNRIPVHYYMQILHGLLVTGFDFVIVKAQLKHQYMQPHPLIEVRHYEFHRQDVTTELRQLYKIECDWWHQYMEEAKCPPIVLKFC